MKIHILESEDWVKCAVNKDDIAQWVTEYSTEAFGILKGVSDSLNIIVIPGLPHISSTKGVGGSTYNDELIDITFDATIPFGVEKFRQYLREAIFHEMNHSMYERFFPREDRQLYWTVLEGLGTVFDRDYANGEHFLSGGEHYTVKITTETEKRNWIKKYILTPVRYQDVPDDNIGMVYQVGVWLVDRAQKNSDKNVIELTHMSCDDVLELAKV